MTGWRLISKEMSAMSMMASFVQVDAALRRIITSLSLPSPPSPLPQPLHSYVSKYPPAQISSTLTFIGVSVNPKLMRLRLASAAPALEIANTGTYNQHPTPAGLNIQPLPITSATSPKTNLCRARHVARARTWQRGIITHGQPATQLFLSLSRRSLKR